MVAQLEACPGCGRHVRVSERECPFCGETLELAGAPAPLLPTARLSRGQIMGFRTLVGAGLVGASAAGLTSGCEFGHVVPVYGAPCDPPTCDGSGALGGTATAMAGRIGFAGFGAGGNGGAGGRAGAGGASGAGTVGGAGTGGSAGVGGSSGAGGSAGSGAGSGGGSGVGGNSGTGGEGGEGLGGEGGT